MNTLEIAKLVYADKIAEIDTQIESHVKYQDRYAHTERVSLHGISELDAIITEGMKKRQLNRLTKQRTELVETITACNRAMFWNKQDMARLTVKKSEIVDLYGNKPYAILIDGDSSVKDLTVWCKKHTKANKNSTEWAVADFHDNERFWVAFFFRDPKIAMQFKLTHAA